MLIEINSIQVPAKFILTGEKGSQVEILRGPAAVRAKPCKLPLGNREGMQE